MRSSQWRWTGRPEAIVTDGLLPYGTTLRDILATHGQETYLTTAALDEGPVGGGRGYCCREVSLAVGRMLPSVKK